MCGLLEAIKSKVYCFFTQLRGRARFFAPGGMVIAQAPAGFAAEARAPPRMDLCL